MQQNKIKQKQNTVYPKLYEYVEIRDIKLISDELFYYANFMKNTYGNGIRLFKKLQNIKGFNKFIQNILFEIIENNINYRDFVDSN